MNATGIPPHTSVMDKLDKLEYKFDSAQHQMFARLETLFYEKFGNVTTINDETIDRLTARFLIAIQGAGILPVVQPAVNTTELSNVRTIGNPDTYELFNWGGGFRFIPEGFVFPHKGIDCRMLYDLWHNGDGSLKIRPFKLIEYDVGLGRKHDRISFAKERNYYAKAKRVMSAITDAILSLSTAEDFNNCDWRRKDELFTLGFKKIFPNNTSYFSPMSYITVSDKLPKLVHGVN